MSTPHHHEAWQIRESAKGGTYCAACGVTVTWPMPLRRCTDTTHPPIEHFHTRLDVADGGKDGSFVYDAGHHSPVRYSHSGEPDPLPKYVDLPPLPPLPEGYPKPGHSPEYVEFSYDVGLHTRDGVLTVSCGYCNTVVGTFTEAERTIAERIATEHGGYHH